MGYSASIMKYRSATEIFFDGIVLEYPRTVLLCILLVVGFLAFQGRHFRLDASSETLVLEDDESLHYTRQIYNRYGKHNFLVLAYTPEGGLFSDETLSDLARLRDELSALERVSSVVSILDVPLLQSSSVSLTGVTSGDEEFPTLGSPEIDKGRAKAELGSSPIYRDLLVSADMQTTAVLIYLAKDPVYEDLLRRRDALRSRRSGSSGPEGYRKMYLEAVLERLERRGDELQQMRHQDIVEIRKIMDKYRGGGELFLGGVSMIADDMIRFIRSDLKVFGLGVLFLLVLVLGVIFRRLRWIFLPMLCCVVSIISMVGLLGWFGWEVTVVSSNFISLQLIMTLAIAIHLMVRYRELLRLEPGASNRRLILETVVLKLRPCVFSVATTVVGFGSLVFCDILPVITFGWMMVAGLIVSLIVTFLLFPTVLVLLAKEGPEYIGGRGRFWPGRDFSLTSLLARFTEARGSLILIISGVVLVFSVVGISRLKVENSFINYFDEDTEIYQGMKLIDRQLGGTTPLDVLVNFEKSGESPGEEEFPGEQGDDVFDEFAELEEERSAAKYWFTSEKMDRIRSVHGYLDELRETGKVLSPASILAVAEKLNDGKPLESFELALLYNESPERFRDMLITPYVSVEHNQARFWVRVRDSDPRLDRSGLLAKIKEGLTGELGFDGENVHFAGLLVLYTDMLESLFGSQIVTLGVTVFLLWGMFLFLFRSLRIALTAILVNVFPVAVVLGVMGWLDTPLNMMTITIAAIGVGIGVDDAIHYIHRFKYEHSRGGAERVLSRRGYVEMMYRCHGSIGHAMYYTSVTIITGFSILALSNFVPNVYFGLLTGLAMLIALVADLTLLPYMLILVKALGGRGRRASVVPGGGDEGAREKKT